MIKLLGTIPKGRFYVAVSGGVDSMAAYDFLKRGKHKCRALFINHNTEASTKAHKFLMEYLKGDFTAEQIPTSKSKGKSWEEHWRDERYKIFESIALHTDPADSHAVVTAHHLDDVLETWLHSSIHGQSKLIPYNHANAIRPFLATPKSEFIKWAKQHRVDWIDDASNLDVKFQRNYIRHTLMPYILNINPGIANTLRKKLLKRGWL